MGEPSERKRPKRRSGGGENLVSQGLARYLSTLRFLIFVGICNFCINLVFANLRAFPRTGCQEPREGYAMISNEDLVAKCSDIDI